MKKIGIVVALAAILIYSSLIFAQDFNAYKAKEGNAFLNRFGTPSMPGSWANMGLLAVLICLFSNILIFLAGMALESENLKRYARSEFLQVTASALMIFLAVELLYTLTSPPPDYLGISAFDLMGSVLGNGASAVDCAAVAGGKFYIWQGYGNLGSGPLGAFKCKVQEKINALDRAYNNVVETNMPLEQMTSICINLFGVPVYCGDWDLSLHNEVEKSHLIATKIISLLMPLHAQFVLAEYIQKNMLAVFLPVGLVLRILPFTRGVGGLFIALAIGFYFIFPTFFLLTDPTFVKQDASQRNMLQGVCFTGFKGSAVLMAGVLSSTAISSQSALSSASAEEMVYQITIGTMFFPFIALVITLIFVRAVTPILGGDLGELMRMVTRLG